jgi:hypothetical protein
MKDRVFKNLVSFCISCAGIFLMIFADFLFNSGFEVLSIISLGIGIIASFGGFIPLADSFYEWWNKF